MVDEYKIVNNVTSKGLKFFNAFVVSDNVTVNNVSIAQAGGKSTANFARNLGGFRRLLTIDFLLINDGTDQSTSGDNKVTISEQNDFLTSATGVIQADGGNQFDVKYTLTVFRDGVVTDIVGSVEDLSIRGSPSEANILRGTLNLFESTN